MPPNPVDQLQADLAQALARLAVLEARVARLSGRIDWITTDLWSHRGGYCALSPAPSGW